MMVYAICIKIISYIFGLKNGDYFYITAFTFPVVSYFCGKGKGRTRTGHEDPAEE